MRKVNQGCFRTEKAERISEKVMMTRLIFTVALILLLLPGMCYTAYAVYTSSVISKGNVIAAAGFDADVSVTDGAGNDVPFAALGDGLHTATLPAGNYTITLTPGGTAENGFFLMDVEGTAETFHTQQLSEKGVKQTVTFTLELQSHAQVELQAHWGTSSYYGYTSTQAQFYIVNGGPTIHLPGAAPVNSSSNEKQNEAGETVYVVCQDDTLEAIAAQYGTTVELLMAYNELSDSNMITVGQELKIPPAGWTIPEADTPDQNTDDAANDAAQTGGAEDPGAESGTDAGTDEGGNKTDPSVDDGGDSGEDDSADVPADGEEGADDTPAGDGGEDVPTT